LRLSFLQTSRCLLESDIDAVFSGTTTVVVLIIGNHVWCANVGDS